MKTIVTIAAILAGATVANAQRQAPATMVIGSASGQFFVSARNVAISPRSLELSSGPDMVTLEPPLLAVSCERMKQELLHELNTSDQWRGKIFVVLRPARTAYDPIVVTPERLGGNWASVVQLPDVLGRDRFLEAIVRACLLEIANRNATDHSAEIPEWMVRGFTRELMGSSGIKLVLPPPLTKENGMNVSRMTVDFSDGPRAPGNLTRRLNPLAEAAEILRTNPPLSFDELSWPTDAQLSSADGVDVYGSSAQLFLSELSHMKNGRECLRATLEKMPDYLNWQLAFLDAFQGTFQQPLDIEKWWALELTEFGGRDLTHVFTPQESARQLDALFQFPIEVQIGDSPPMRTDISLQTIIRGWSRTQQLQALKKKLWELEILRLRLSRDFIPLLDEYRQVLQTYYRKRNDILREGPIPDKIIKETLERLDALDGRRADMRQLIQTPMASAASAGAP
jgi:hypothetical protein